jgi:hypothetical protein
MRKFRAPLASFQYMGPLPTAVRVRCLACGAVYTKPLGEGTAADNPGCPKCGYVGWRPAGASSNGVIELRHFAEDRLHRRSA